MSARDEVLAEAAAMLTRVGHPAAALVLQYADRTGEKASATAPTATPADRAKAPWGRTEDGRPLLPEGAHWTDVPEMVDRTVAAIQARVDQAQPGHWYEAPATETGLPSGTVRTRVDGYPCTVGQITNMLPADRQLVLHAHDDLTWCLGMIAKFRATPAPQPEAEPVPLRWGLDDVMYGDDDTTTLLLSGPDLEPYWLELDPERTAALQDCLTGPGEPAQPQPLSEGQQDLLAHIYATGGRCSTGCAETYRKLLGRPFYQRRSDARDDLHALRDSGFLAEQGPIDGRYYTVACPNCGSPEGVLCPTHPGTTLNPRKDGQS